MKIIVCIKEVPNTAHVRWKKDNTIDREKAESIINPYDEYGLEAAIRLKEKVPHSSITVITMSPRQAIKSLRKAIAMGADKGLLISDKKFAGSDTYATSLTLAQAIKKFVAGFDLIVCGQFAIDGDTGQTGPGLAEHLNIPQISYTNKLEYTHNGSIVAGRQTEKGSQQLEMKLPGLVCIHKNEYKPRIPTIKGILKARKMDIPIINIDDLGLKPHQVGIKGSPTYVSKIFEPKQKENGEIIDENEPSKAVSILVQKLKSRLTESL